MTESEGTVPPDERDAELEAFWLDVRTRGNTNRLEVVVGANPRGSLRPPAWSFSADPVTADRMLAELLDGRRTAVTSALAADRAGGAAPEPGDLGIVLDGAGRPRALVRTVRVETVAYEDVDDGIARADGAEDVSGWRSDNAPELRESLDAVGERLTGDTEIVVEHLQRIYPRRVSAATTTEVMP